MILIIQECSFQNLIILLFVVQIKNKILFLLLLFQTHENKIKNFFLSLSHQRRTCFGQNLDLVFLEKNNFFGCEKRAD